jgi:D-alanyl-D-alanine carboxypeptidase
MCGGGYRSSADQIATRKANGCPDVYNSPSSACHPPTAPPGKSMHERGLAIDFTQNGHALSRDTSGFKWLSAHAGSYGFHNLPSEAWHWSTNGN